MNENNFDDFESYVSVHHSKMRNRAREIYAEVYAEVVFSFNSEQVITLLR
jgi:hypothetical protein